VWTHKGTRSVTTRPVVPRRFPHRLTEATSCAIKEGLSVTIYYFWNTVGGFFHSYPSPDTCFMYNNAYIYMCVCKVCPRKGQVTSRDTSLWTSSASIEGHARSCGSTTTTTAAPWWWGVRCADTSIYIYIYIYIIYMCVCVCDGGGGGWWQQCNWYYATLCCGVVNAVRRIFFSWLV